MIGYLQKFRINQSIPQTINTTTIHRKKTIIKVPNLPVNTVKNKPPTSEVIIIVIKFFIPHSNYRLLLFSPDYPELLSTCDKNHPELLWNGVLGSCELLSNYCIFDIIDNILGAIMY